MFAKRTVFVIGAGASAEYGLPVGDTLKNGIAKSLRFRFDFGRQKSGSPQLLRILMRRFKDEINSYTRAGNELADTIGSFISIDEALHYFSDREDIVLLGKLAAAEEILLAEQNSKLFDKNQRRPRLNAIPDGWLEQFLSIALSFSTRNDTNNLFENVTIINFNYDRTVEYFLYWALQKSAGLSAAEASAAVNRLTVIRPYGSLGSLEWSGQGGNVPFAHQAEDDLFAIAEKLRTYTEQKVDGSLVQEVASALHDASLLVVLGFGFHEQNLQLLKQENTSSINACYCTVAGIDNKNHDLLQYRLRNVLQSPAMPQLLNMRAGELLQKLRPSIAVAAS
jgi:hypothetical protein